MNGTEAQFLGGIGYGGGFQHTLGNFHALLGLIGNDGDSEKLLELLLQIEFAVGELVSKIVQTGRQALPGIDVILQLGGGGNRCDFF